jgi:hypothetical protein
MPSPSPKSEISNFKLLRPPPIQPPTSELQPLESRKQLRGIGGIQRGIWRREVKGVDESLILPKPGKDGAPASKLVGNGWATCRGWGTPKNRIDGGRLGLPPRFDRRKCRRYKTGRLPSQIFTFSEKSSHGIACRIEPTSDLQDS